MATMPPISSIQMQADNKSFGSFFVKSQLTKPKTLPPSTDLSGRVAIVTGASSGLGFHCCRHLLSFRLSHLIIAVRSLGKGEKANLTLGQEYPNAKIEVWELEMGSYESIQDIVRRAQQLSRLDIAILNAGIVKPTFDINPRTGHEDVIQVNYLSTMLLAILLLPVLKSKSPAGSPGRLTIVGSGTAYGAAFQNRNEIPLLASFDKQPVPYDTNAATERYWVSKLLGHFFIAQLATYVRPNDVVVNIVDPGLCKGSELNRDTSGVPGAIMSVVKTLFGRTLEVGSSTYVDAAVIKGEESHGSFIGDWKIKP
jgi:NAD(P)-dependent dehydrogenase (short-subunit alcohol dehydrogenase family)